MMDENENLDVEAYRQRTKIQTDQLRLELFDLILRTALVRYEALRTEGQSVAFAMEETVRETLSPASREALRG